LAFGHSQDALDHLEQAAAMAPDNPDIQYDLGIYFEQHNNFTNAFNCFSNAIVLRPDSAVEQFGLAHTLANLGQLTAAAAHYREALRMDPNYADAKTEFARFLTSHPELR
jgi:Tfp pilus assembly protein PilF